MLTGAVTTSYSTTLRLPGAFGACRERRTAPDRSKLPLRPQKAVRSVSPWQARSVGTFCRVAHANHVVQKCILLLKPEASQFIIDELQCGIVGQIARHKYGCRIIQQLADNCKISQIHQLVESLIPEVVSLSRHPYGNYVVQNLLQRCTSEQRRRMARALASQMRLLCTETFGCAVLSTALLCVPHAERQALAQSLLQEPDLIMNMACTRFGHVAVLRAVESLSCAERAEATRLLWSEVDALGFSRYGRLLLKQLEALELEPALLSKGARAGA